MKRARVCIEEDDREDVGEEGRKAMRLETDLDGPSVESGVNVFPQMWPLLMPCILEQVLSYLPLQDLKRCKTVCRVWREEVTRVMKRLKTVTARDDNFDEARDFLFPVKQGSEKILSQLWCKHCSTSCSQFEKLVLFNGTLLHQLHLEKCTVQVDSFGNLIATNAFPNLQFFSLRQATYVDVGGRYSVFLAEFCSDLDNPPFANLKALDIDERGPETQTTLENIANMCPNLERLAFSNCPVPNRNMRRGRNYTHFTLSKLEFLQLAPIDGRKMDSQYFETLKDMKLRSLKSLFLYGMTPGGRKRMKTLQTFLRSVASSLTSLHLGQRILYHPEYQPRSESPFPVALPNLRRMSVGPGFVHSLKLLEKLPRLSSFTCNRMVASDWDQVVANGIPKGTTTISSLDLGDITDGPLMKIAFAFPTLTRLEINVSRVGNHDAIFRSVCGGFPKLQMFNMYDLTNQNILSDSGITGYKPEDLEQMDNDYSPSKKREFSYIGDLKCLIDMRIQYLSGSLTDKAVLFGIKDSTNIFALDISKSQITDLSLETLAKHASFLSVLHIRDCSHVTEAGIQKFKQLRPKVQVRT